MTPQKNSDDFSAITFADVPHVTRNRIAVCGAGNRVGPLDIARIWFRRGGRGGWLRRVSMPRVFSGLVVDGGRQPRETGAALMTTKLIAGALACALLSGCATQGVRLTVRSLPEGAAVIQNGAVVGTTPMVLTYNAKAQFAAGACLTLLPLTARWASGAARRWNGSLCPANGRIQQFTFMRPANAPGAALDARFAATRAYQAAAQAQIDAQNEQVLDKDAGVLAGEIGCIAAGGCRPRHHRWAPQQSSTTTQPKLDCTTTQGPFDQVHTVCH